MIGRLGTGAAVLAMLLAAGVARGDGLAGLLGALQPGARPAPPLGGDPFRSPLVDDTGWWAASALASPRAARIEAEWRAPVHGASSADGRTFAWSSTRDAAWKRGTWRWAVGASQLAGRGRVGGDAGAVRLETSGARVDGGLRVRDVAPGLTLQAAGPLWSESGSARSRGAGLGARWTPHEACAAQAHWESFHVPERFASTLRGEPVGASLNLAGERWQADALVHAPGALTIEGSAARSRWRPRDARRPALDYQLEPAGDGGVEQVSATVGRAPRRAIVRWTHERFDVSGDGCWGGERFARLSYLRGDVHAWLAGVEQSSGGRRVLLDVERGELSATGRATLETWPFTEPTIDLLGLRRIGRMQASAEWWRAHAAAEHALGRAWTLSGGASWYDVTFTGQLDSWRPAFLALGVADYRTDALPWTRAQLALLSCGVAWRGRAMGAALELQQPVWGRAFAAEGAAGSDGAPTSGSAADPAPGRASLRESGTRLRVCLTTGSGPR